MGRPKTPPFTLGKLSISTHPTTPGMKQVRGRYIDGNGKRQEVTASGRTDAAARRAIQAKVNDARDTYKGGDETLNSSTLLPRAAAIWLDSKEREQLATGTLASYRHYVENTIDNGVLSARTVVEANNIARIEAWLTGIADSRGSSAAKQARKVLGGVLGHAERVGAIPASVMPRVKTPKAKAGTVGDRKCQDRECDYDCGKRHLDTDRAFTEAEAEAVLAAADKAKADIGDLCYFMFSTGVRLSEALHCTAWEDVNLKTKTVRVRGTKTDAADRTLPLSDALMERLTARAKRHGKTGQVFGTTYYATKLGQPRDVNNVAKAMRRVFASVGMPWAGSHTFRRTVASWMDANGKPLAEIANTLGHSDVNVTAGYLGRRTAPTAVASIMVLPSQRPALRVVS